MHDIAVTQSFHSCYRVDSLMDCRHIFCASSAAAAVGSFLPAAGSLRVKLMA